MKGSSIGELDVYIATTYGKPSKKVWHRQGNQGDQWIRGEVVLSSNADFQVMQ